MAVVQHVTAAARTNSPLGEWSPRYSGRARLVRCTVLYKLGAILTSRRRSLPLARRGASMPATLPDCAPGVEPSTSRPSACAHSSRLQPRVSLTTARSIIVREPQESPPRSIPPACPPPSLLYVLHYTPLTLFIPAPVPCKNPSRSNSTSAPSSADCNPSSPPSSHPSPPPPLAPQFSHAPGSPS